MKYGPGYLWFWSMPLAFLSMAVLVVARLALDGHQFGPFVPEVVGSVAVLAGFIAGDRLDWAVYRRARRRKPDRRDLGDFGHGVDWMGGLPW